MRGGDARLRHELTDFGGHVIDIGHAVVHEEHLALAHELAANRGGNLAVGARADEGEHGVPLLGGGGQRRGFANTGQRHFEGARDRGCAHGQHVHIGAHLLELFLVFHAEALLLVNDDQAQIFENDALREEAVRTDHHVHRTGCDFFGNLAGFLGLLEAGKHANLHGEARETLTERLVVLLGEQGRGHEHGDLFTVLHGLECGAHGDLGFAEPHVAGDETVHGDFLLHVLLHLVDGGELVGGLVVGEGLFEFALPGGVRGEGMASRSLARRVEFHQVGGDFLDGLAGAGLGLGPVAAAHLRQGGVLATHVVGDEVQLVRGHEESVGCAAALGGGVLDDQVFLHGLHAVDGCGAGHRAGGHLDEAADAVALVHHVVAGVQGERVDGVAAAARLKLLARCGARRVGAAAAEQFGLGEDGELGVLEQEARGCGCLAHLDDAVLEVPGGVLLEAYSACGGHGGGPFLPGVEQSDEPVGRAAAVGEGEDGPLLLDEVAEAFEHPVHGAVEGGGRPSGQGVGVDAFLEGVGQGSVLQVFDGFDGLGGVFEQAVVGGELGDVPPAQVCGEGLGAGAVDGAESAVAQAQLAQVDGRDRVSLGGGVPGGGEEFLVGGDEVFGAGAHSLGFDADHQGSGGQ